MLMNYHELTMNQAANDPAKKQQFAVICTVMTAVLAYALMTSAAFEPMNVQNGVFPGGNFAFKFTNRDYAASFGMGRAIGREIGRLDDVTEGLTDRDTQKAAERVQKNYIESIMYHLYLDDPLIMGGRRQRWMSGIMVADSEKQLVDDLMATNNGRKTLTQQEWVDLPARDIFERLPYEYIDLPSVDSLVLQFPHTHGFVSGLVQSYRIIPALRKMAKEQGEEGLVPVVITTCSEEQEMCTHYAPLVQSRTFLMGHPTTEEHNEALGAEHFLDWKGMKEGARMVFPFFKEYIDKLP